MRSHTVRAYLVIEPRKIARYEIYATLCGARSLSEFYDNISKCARTLSNASSMPSDFYVCAWFRVYKYYARNRGAILRGGLE